MSTTERNGVFGVTQAPGSSVRRPMKPATADVMTVFERLIFNSSSRACAWAYWARARSSEATAAW